MTDRKSKDPSQATPRFVVPPIGTCTLAQPGVMITEPKGSDGSNKNLTSSWKSSPCFHFDFQGVAKTCPGAYSIGIKGRVDQPSCYSPMWVLDPAAGTLENDTKTQPTHTAPTSAGVGTLKLMAMKRAAAADCKDEKRIKIFEDHLARDRENFGTGISCGTSCQGPWKFTRLGVAITMPKTWNCFGSVDHAYNGSGSGCVETVNIPMGWEQTEYYGPISEKEWGKINASLRRGDVVSFWSGPPKDHFPQHAHTCIGGNIMYGANNEPESYATWKWCETTSEAYYKAANSSKGLENFITRVVVHKKPKST